MLHIAFSRSTSDQTMRATSVSPLGCQQKKLEQRSERPADFAGCFPQPADFIVAQDAIARAFLRRRPHPPRWRSRYTIFFNAPIEQGCKPGQRSIGLDLGSSVDNPVDQINHVATTNACDWTV